MQQIGDGIYFKKGDPLNKTKSESSNQPNNQAPPKSYNFQQNYIFKNNAELVKLMENEFHEIGDEVRLIYENSEEMITYDPSDYDLIQAVHENLIIINEKVDRMKGLQREIKMYNPISPVVDFNIEGLFTSDFNEKIKGVQMKEKSEGKKLAEVMLPELDSFGNNKGEIINEIEL